MKTLNSSILTLTLLVFGYALAQQQKPSQQVTLENGLQVTMGTCSVSAQTLTCPVEFSNISAKAVMWTPGNYGAVARVIDVEGNAYLATVDYGSVVARMTKPGESNKGTLTVKQVSTSARVLPVVQYGALEFRGVRIQGEQTTQATTRLTTPAPVTNANVVTVKSKDGNAEIQLLGCFKDKDGFHCDFSFMHKYSQIQRLGFDNAGFSPSAFTPDGTSYDASQWSLDKEKYKTSISSSYASLRLEWPANIRMSGQIYFPTQNVPKNIGVLRIRDNLIGEVLFNNISVR